MEEMQEELAGEGHDVAFLAVNKIGAESSQSGLISKCTFPLFQDTSAVGAWTAHGGGKDDIYIYDAQGQLSSYLPFGGSTSINLSTTTGYANVKNAILDALE